MGEAGEGYRQRGDKITPIIDMGETMMPQKAEVRRGDPAGHEDDWKSWRINKLDLVAWAIKNEVDAKKIGIRELCLRYAREGMVEKWKKANQEAKDEEAIEAVARETGIPKEMLAPESKTPADQVGGVESESPSPSPELRITVVPGQGVGTERRGSEEQKPEEKPEEVPASKGDEGGEKPETTSGEEGTATKAKTSEEPKPPQEEGRSGEGEEEAVEGEFTPLEEDGEGGRRSGSNTGDEGNVGKGKVEEIPIDQRPGSRTPSEEEQQATVDRQTLSSMGVGPYLLTYSNEKSFTQKIEEVLSQRGVSEVDRKRLLDEAKRQFREIHGFPREEPKPAQPKEDGEGLLGWLKSLGHETGPILAIAALIDEMGEGLEEIHRLKGKKDISLSSLRKTLSKILEDLGANNINRRNKAIHEILRESRSFTEIQTEINRSFQNSDRHEREEEIRALHAERTPLEVGAQRIGLFDSVREWTKRMATIYFKEREGLSLTPEEERIKQDFNIDLLEQQAHGVNGYDEKMEGMVREYYENARRVWNWAFMQAHGIQGSVAEDARETARILGWGTIPEQDALALALEYKKKGNSKPQGMSRDENIVTEDRRRKAEELRRAFSENTEIVGSADLQDAPSPGSGAEIYFGLTHKEQVFWQARLLLTNARSRIQFGTSVKNCGALIEMQNMTTKQLESLTNFGRVSEAVAIYSMLISRPDLAAKKRPELGGRSYLEIMGLPEKKFLCIQYVDDVYEYRRRVSQFLQNRFGLSEDEASTSEAIAYNLVRVTRLSEFVNTRYNSNYRDEDEAKRGELAGYGTRLVLNPADGIETSDPKKKYPRNDSIGTAISKLVRSRPVDGKGLMDLRGIWQRSPIMQPSWMYINFNPDKTEGATPVYLMEADGMGNISEWSILIRVAEELISGDRDSFRFDWRGVGESPFFRTEFNKAKWAALIATAVDEGKWEGSAEDLIRAMDELNIEEDTRWTLIMLYLAAISNDSIVVRAGKLAIGKTYTGSALQAGLIVRERDLHPDMFRGLR